ncbi:calcium/sodium antiporter [archaeon]|jgi:cation:H+ antiporter|nr:calcium/sodium antiporter [archaeon]MBT4022285.1 calcium/sodium antiporter [archaeon]MBT4271758.1 calcium/sodium antiporter [archaeon]MBT4461402.1 calcium/sodium antiporter [archaeon]MBT4858658.1 calcium/sodium antiporter [archaeon]
MFSHFLFFAFGLLLLVKGSDFFIESSARIAKKLGVSDFLIGLTLTSIGTSIPELASSVSASLNGHSGLIVGNIVGSNIANIGLIIGISAILKPFKTTRKMYARDGYTMILSVILFFVFSLDNVISKFEGIILLIVYVFYILFLLKSDDKSVKKYKFHDFMNYVFDFQYLASVKTRIVHTALKKTPSQRTTDEHRVIKMFKEGMVKDFLIIVLSGAGIIFGAKYLVNEAIWIANLFKLPESVIGLSLIAIGTSLPELIVSINAVRKGFGNLVTGNVLGSNIANIALVVGISSLISPLKVPEASVVYTIPIMLFFSLALLHFIKSGWKIDKKKGIIALISYTIFMILAFFYGWS